MARGILGVKRPAGFRVGCPVVCRHFSFRAHASGSRTGGGGAGSSGREGGRGAGRGDRTAHPRGGGAGRGGKRGAPCGGGPAAAFGTGTEPAAVAVGGAGVRPVPEARPGAAAGQRRVRPAGPWRRRRTVRAAVLLLAAGGCWGAQIAPTAARVTPNVANGVLEGVRPLRIALSTFAELEKRFDSQLSSLGGINDPADLLGTTRGIYLEGYGAVFTAEISLILTPSTNPFRQTINETLKRQVHQRKTARVPVLKQAMQGMLKAAALALTQVPENQQMVFAVRLDYLKWEDTEGLPGLVVVKADRKSALAGNCQGEEQ